MINQWAEGGATGWGYAEVMPYFRKSEGLAPSPDIVIDAAAHNTKGPLGVSLLRRSARHEGHGGGDPRSRLAIATIAIRRVRPCSVPTRSRNHAASALPGW
jgi:choline dehydrogenase-like flavoprotein